MKKIVITITQDGTAKIDHQGFVGKACENAISRAIAAGLGTTTEDIKKAEYFQQAPQQQQIQR